MFTIIVFTMLLIQSVFIIDCINTIMVTIIIINTLVSTDCVEGVFSCPQWSMRQEIFVARCLC